MRDLLLKVTTYGHDFILNFLDFLGIHALKPHLLQKGTSISSIITLDETKFKNICLLTQAIPKISEIGVALVISYSFYAYCFVIKPWVIKRIFNFFSNSVANPTKFQYDTKLEAMLLKYCKHKGVSQAKGFGKR